MNMFSITRFFSSSLLVPFPIHLIQCEMYEFHLSLTHSLWLCISTEEIYWLSSRKISCRNRNSPSRELTAKVCRLVVVVVFIMPDCFRFTRTLTWNWSVTSDKKEKALHNKFETLLFCLILCVIRWTSMWRTCQVVKAPSWDVDVFEEPISYGYWVEGSFLKLVMKDFPWALHNQLTPRILRLITMTYWFFPPSCLLLYALVDVVCI